MGEVVNPRRSGWWNKVDVTGRDATTVEPVVIQAVSLDVLAEQAHVARNAVVHCEAELDKRMRHLERCQQALSNRMVEVAKQNGIREIKFRALPAEGDEE
jgi:hypothetical protein